MAMVRQLTEGEIINGDTPEDDSQSSEPMESYGSRPQSRASSSSSKRNSPTLPALQYTKEELMKLSTSPLAKTWPTRLDPIYSNSSGKWDPDRWFMNHRGDRLMPLEESRPKRERQEDGLTSQKRKSSDPKERIKEEKDDIVLSPQRRSFGTGCHVIQQSSLARRPGSPTDNRDDNYREPSRRIGSGRIITRDRDQRDWDRDREYGYGNRNDRRDRFDQDDDKDLRRYSSRYNRNDRRSRGGRIDEVEPEWFSGGPTSQSETIELCGFDDPSHDGDNRKAGKKKRKQNSRRSSLKSDEGEKNDGTHDEKTNPKRGESKHDDPKSNEAGEAKGSGKSGNTGFDLDQLFKMDWIPGLLPGECPPEAADKDMGCSRFSQWFRKDSPLPDVPESGNNSRRSSLHEELIANVLNSIVEPQIAIPSPTGKPSDNFFAPISPALARSPNYMIPPPTMPPGVSKDLLELLQSSKSNSLSAANRDTKNDSTKSVKELTADLKRIVLGGDKPTEEKSAFDKLLQHMSDSKTPQTASLGPLDKSKAVQEQDLLQDMLSRPQRRSSSSPLQQPFQMFEEKQPPIFKLLPSGSSSTSYPPSNQNTHNDAFAQLMQQKHQHDQRVQQMQQLQEQQNHLQQNQQSQQPQQAQNTSMQGITFDVLSKLLNNSSQPTMNPASPNVQQQATGQALNRNEPPGINVLQYQRQQEMLSNLLKQQQQQQQVLQSLSQQRNLIQSLQQQQQQRCPSAKDMPIPQTLALPTLGISPRQSPMPPVDGMGSAIPNQGRIPSPLVFGQQPPALSHAPAPIHPSAIVQAISQNSVSPNTLQVQNPVVLQRVPSPQELAVHTQSILQNALIKRKLEEQKENYRKRHEAQRTSSPVTTKNGMSVSPLKGLSPTIAFTPTSVMRKIQSDKTENRDQKIIQQSNGNKIFGDIKPADSLQNFQKMTPTGLSSMGLSNLMDSINFSTANNNMINTQQNIVNQQVPRAVHGQSMSQPRSIHGAMNSTGPPMSQGHQGRPIVKVGMSQPLNASSDLTRTGMAPNKAAAVAAAAAAMQQHNKPFLSGNNQSQAMHHDVDSNFDLMNKYTWSNQLARQSQNVSGVQQQLQMAATYAAMNRPALNNPHRSNPPLIRPSVNIAASAGSVQSSNMNYPMMRNTVQTPIRGQGTSVNPLSHLGLQVPRGQIDSRQLQALAQTHRIHPNTLHQLFMNSQNQAAAVQAQVAGGFPGSRDGKHHLMPGQPGVNRQSPVNLTKWFGNDVLKQKMPDMPPMPANQQKAMHVEDLERQQQSTAVHN